MKRGNLVVISLAVLFLVVILAVPFASANVFTNFWNKITGNAVASTCGNGVLDPGEVCDYAAPLGPNNAYGSNCTTSCGVSGTANGWAGCRGTGVSVCSDKVNSQYYIDHPLCIKNTDCGGEYFSCNSNFCPQPTASEVIQNSTTTTTCTDSDGGINYYTQGTVTLTTTTIPSEVPPVVQKATDYCYNSTSVREFYCMLEGPSSYSLGYESYSCPNGCLNGACIQANNTNTTNYFCNDSDGFNPYQKGTVTDNSPLTNGATLTHTDFCWSNSTGQYVNEFYCTHIYQGSRLVACTNGCLNGACINEPVNTTNTNVTCGVPQQSAMLTLGDQVSVGGLFIEITSIDSNGNVHLNVQGPNTQEAAPEEIPVILTPVNSSKTEVIGGKTYSISEIYFDSTGNVKIEVEEVCGGLTVGPLNINLSCSVGTFMNVSEGMGLTVNGLHVKINSVNSNGTIGLTVGTENTAISTTNGYDVSLNDDTYAFDVSASTIYSNGSVGSITMEIKRICPSDLTCMELGGQICTATLACGDGGHFVNATDSTRCCIGGGNCENSTQTNITTSNATGQACSNGCALNGTCYPIGYRDSGNYCSPNKTFVAQVQDNEACNNNFECSSNVCASSQCVSQSLIQKIINFFRNLFG